MKIWESIAHWTSDTAPNPQKPCNSTHIFKYLKTEQNPGILKKIIYDHAKCYDAYL